MVGQRNAHPCVHRRTKKRYPAWNKDTVGSKFGHNMEQQTREERMRCESMIANIEEGSQARQNHQHDHGVPTSENGQSLP